MNGISHVQKELVLCEPYIMRRGHIRCITTPPGHDLAPYEGPLTHATLDDLFVLILRSVISIAYGAMLAPKTDIELARFAIKTHFSSISVEKKFHTNYCKTFEN